MDLRKWGVGSLVAAVTLAIIAIAAWFTHIYRCFTEDAWGFLIAGAIFFPIAIVHGIGIWFGLW